MGFPAALSRASGRLLLVAWLGCAVFAARAFTDVGGAGLERLFSPWLYDFLFVAAAAICAVRVVRGGRDRGAWLCFTLGVLSLLAGDIYWFAVIVPLDEVPFPSPADGLYLGLYPACYVGLTLLIRSRVPGLPRAAWLDGLIGAVTAAALVAAVAFRPVLDALDGSVAIVATTIAYPAADVLLLAFVAGALVTVGDRADRTLHLLAAALTFQTLADCVYLVQSARGTYAEGGPLDVLWIVAVLLIATAARQPAPAAVPTTGRVKRRGELMIGVFAAISGGLVIVEAIVGLDTVSELLLSAAVILVILRLGLAISEIRGLEHNRVEARTDDLTGLGNRRAFYAAVEEHLAAPAAEPIAVILMDLDRFKEFNDTLGHGTGDELLCEFARRLRHTLPGVMSLARLGGDEFVVLLAGGVPEALDASRRVQDALEAPFHLDGITTPVSASAGIAVFPDHGNDRSSLMRHADIAMYRAKEMGTGSEVFAELDSTTGREHLVLAGELQAAIEDGRLVLHYQPKVDVASGATVGLEALVRWQHPERGLLMPDAFLPVAERSGLMSQLSLRVIDMALAQQRKWRENGIDLQVAVNLAAADLRNAGFAATVAERLEQAAIPADRLLLEITEDIIMLDPRRAIDVLARLGEMGIPLALDDYGTGHASLAQLKSLPVQELKIDRSFVRDLATDAQDAVIVRSTVELGRNLGLRVVAEGVESAAALELLGVYGCDLAQGYHVSRPLPAEAVQGWLATRPAAVQDTAQILA